MINLDDIYWMCMYTLMQLLGLTYGELCVLIWGLICPVSVVLPELFLAICTPRGSLKWFRCFFSAFMMIVYALLIWFLLRLPMDWDTVNRWDNMNLWLIGLSSSWTGGFNMYYGLLWFCAGVAFPIFCWVYYFSAIVRTIISAQSPTS